MGSDLKYYCRCCGKQMIPIYDDIIKFDGYTGEQVNPPIIRYECPMFNKKRESHDKYWAGYFFTNNHRDL